MKIVIIGGVAGGATAAARLRRLDEDAEIIILERSGYISYANCGLPYYIGGIIEDKDKLTLQTPESFARRFRIDARVHNEAISFDPDVKTVTVRNLDDESVYEETYDMLILSPGATAARPDMPGIDGERILTLRTVEDTFRIRDLMETTSASHAVVVGGGFIGLEMAENLIGAGIGTTLLQRSAKVLPPLDYDMACQVHSYLRSQGLDLRLNSPIDSYEPLPDGVRVHLVDGTTLDTDFVILAIGVTPDTALAKDAGLALGIKDAIIVDEHMRTSAPDVYAVGDAVEVHSPVSGQEMLIPLAGPANKQGRIAADNICGLDSTFKGSLGSAVVKLFDMTVASTGLNERTAQAAGLDFDEVVTFSASHATYYPGAKNMTLKTLFEPATGRILGAQIVGFEGVDKRIDVLATAIGAKMTDGDLRELDLAYAPPYSSAKDPVNMAGFVIGNIRDGVVKQYLWSGVEGLPKDGSVILLDVRSAEEYGRGHIDGTLNIPLDSLRDHLDELDPTKPLYVNCHSGLRSYLACRILSQRGFVCHNLAGGYRFYSLVIEDRDYDATPMHPCGVRI